MIFLKACIVQIGQYLWDGWSTNIVFYLKIIIPAKDYNSKKQISQINGLFFNQILPCVKFLFNIFLTFTFFLYSNSSLVS